MRLPRFTLRRLMVLVAVVAGLLAGGTEGMRCYRLHREYAATAEHYAEMEAGERASTLVIEANVAELESKNACFDPAHRVLLAKRLAAERRYLKYSRANAEDSAEVRSLYDRAARYPWLPVPPDPPPPE